MTDKNLARTEQTPLSRETTRDHERYINPAVDIFETDDGLTLVADVPGLDEKSLEISVEQGVLTLKGEAPAGAGDVNYREYAMAGYWRQFHLPESVDAAKAEAKIVHGVLTLHLPKAEAAKPRRIEVTVH